MSNPFLGVILHALGGFAAGSFYLPIKKVKQWHWESGWLVNGVMAWLIAPLLIAAVSVTGLREVLTSAPAATLWWTYFFGVLWGVGSLTFGLTMRYLGIGLGMALALGLTAAFGTLVPPIYDGSIGAIIRQPSGQVVLLGVLISFLGIAICGRAGVLKDRQLTEEQKQEGVKEFDLRKGVLYAIVAGVLSSCFAFGIQAGAPLADAAAARGTAPLWINGPVFIVILLGGATTNLSWCLVLNYRNRSYTDYTDRDTPLARNYALALAAGLTWYLQFMFYGMGSTQMGRHDFASWSIHMAFIIVFSTLWGFATREWRGVDARTIRVIVLGLVVLTLSTVVIGYGNQL